MALSFERLHNAFSTTLTAAITTTTQSTISVAAAAPGWAASGPFRVRIDNEWMVVTGGASTTTWTVIRRAEGSTAATHLSGATVTHVITDIGLGSAIDSTRPNVVNAARFNTWGVKFRGVTPSGGLGNTTSYFGTGYNATLVAQQFLQAVQVGANHIKGIGTSYEVIDGTVSQSTFLGRVEAWLDTAWRKGLFVSFLITDNLNSTVLGRRPTLAEEIVQGQALATLLDQYPNVVAIDVINEVNGWQVQRGGPGTYDSSQPDATSIAWVAGSDSLTAAIRACTSKPVGYSLFVSSSTELLANGSGDWLPLLVPNVDYLDLHPYWPSTSDMPLSVLQSLHALYPEIAVYFGELSVANFNANTPEVKRRIETARSYVEMPYVPGINIYTLDDYTSPGGTGTGMFDQSGNERPNMSYPFRTLPRRAGYAGPQTIPLVTPASPLPLATTLMAVPFANFPLRASNYATTLGDPNYRVFANIGGGVVVGDALEVQVYNLDTSTQIILGTATVPTTGGPTVADSSPQNNPGSVIGSPTPSVATGKFSSGIVIANNSQQVQWPNVFQPAGTQPFTIECWVKRSRTGVTESFLAQWLNGTTADASWVFQLDGATNKVIFYYVDTTGALVGATSTAAVTDTTTFHHVAATYDGSTVRCFLDGVLGSGTSSTTPQLTPNSHTITLSSLEDGPSASPFFGTVDEFRISNIARYTTGFTPSASAFTSDANTMLLAHLDAILSASTNTVTPVATEWQYVQPNQAINAGVKFRNATAVRGAVLSASLEVRYT